MAAHTLQLLDGMLAAGKVTQEAYGLLQGSLQSTTQEAGHSIPGNVTLRSPSVGELEALSKVLNTPELLEHILRSLTPQDLLLRAQVASKAFKHAIDTSPSIRRKMFRDADRAATEHVSLPYQVRGAAGQYVDQDLLQFRIFEADAAVSYFPLTLAKCKRLLAQPSLCGLQLLQPPPQQVTVEVIMRGPGYCTCDENGPSSVLKGPITVGHVLRELRWMVVEFKAACEMESRCASSYMKVTLTAAYSTESPGGSTS